MLNRRVSALSAFIRRARSREQVLIFRTPPDVTLGMVRESNRACAQRAAVCVMRRTVAARGGRSTKAVRAEVFPARVHRPLELSYSRCTTGPVRRTLDSRAASATAFHKPSGNGDLPCRVLRHGSSL
jgi:hypothetical protein